MVLCVRSYWYHNRIAIFSGYTIDSKDGVIWIGKLEQRTFPLPPLPKISQNWSRVPPFPTLQPSTLTLMTNGTVIQYSSAVIWFGEMPFLWLLGNAIDREIKRNSGRRCLHCGYDLRATPDRCPECGTIPAKIV
jgi:hypothetical protein